MTRLVMFEYDAEWPRMFEVEASQLRSIWSDQIVAIHHIGSTAVPGLTAKPIIDSMIVIKDVLRVHEFDDGMISLGYRPRGECLAFFGTPGRFYYSRDTGGIRTHQAHVMQTGHPEVEQKLNFRDYLRSHSDVANEYATLKSRLIRENSEGIGEYILGKEAFIKNCIAKAAAWKNTEQSTEGDGPNQAFDTTC